MLKSRNVGGVEIFRSSDEHERKVYRKIKECVFQRFRPGKYTDKLEITSIVNLMYEKYYEILDEYLPKVHPRDFVSFLVSEYERYGKVSDVHKLNKLSKDDDEFWLSYACHARRGIKHVLELLCRSRMDASKVSNTKESQEDAISMVFIAVEELVSLYMRSDGYRHVFDDVTLTLDPEKYTYFHVEQDGSIPFDIRESARDLPKYVPSPMFLQDVVAHGEILNESFIETLGLSYTDTLGIINWVIDTYSDSANPESLGVFEWEEVIRTITSAFKMPPSQAELILEGFCLSSENMEGRELFRPKQEYRAYKRAFFKDSCDGVNRVFFSRRMALECLTLLLSDVPFKKLPPEWCSDSVSEALNVLSLKAGRWFEKIVGENLEKIGIIGSSSVKYLSFGNADKLKIPDKIGEIDFLGFNEEQKLLVVIEVKQVGFATEPRMFLDDLSKFTSGSSNYSSKFIKKYNWVLDNIECVEKHFSHRFNLTTKLNVVGYAMVTLYPTIAAIKIKEFTCTSVSEFMNECNATESWPFSKTPIHRPG